MCGFNEAWRLWIIVESLAELTNGDFEDSFADNGFWPHGVEKSFFGDELARTCEEVVEYCECFRSELYGLGASPQTLVGQVQAKRIEDYALFGPHCVTERYRTFTAGLRLKTHAGIIVRS